MYKGLNIPYIDYDKWDGTNYCHGYTIQCPSGICLECLFFRKNTDKFDEWNVQRLRKNKLERIINV